MLDLSAPAAVPDAVPEAPHSAAPFEESKDFFSNDKPEIVAADAESADVEAAGVEGEGEGALDEVMLPPVAQSVRVKDDEFDELYRRWKASGDPLLRDRLILMHRNLVTFLARRFAYRGDGIEDVIQQGMIALIYALDHFDPSRGVRFATFATPTIVGEIRRYFRDKARSVRIPRRAQELHLAVTARIEALTQQLNRSPTYLELSQSLNVPVEEVIEALETARAMDIASLDEPLNEEGEGAASLIDSMGELDPAIARWDEYSLLRAALAKLSARQRMVLEAAYFQNLSQVEIADEMKVSQMHISRLLRGALAQLRQYLEEDH